tara:strand:+ start:103 stop:366 length:264 start_codon:yes stop_codon:yes gene_type:complete
MKPNDGEEWQAFKERCKSVLRERGVLRSRQEQEEAREKPSPGVSSKEELKARVAGAALAGSSLAGTPLPPMPKEIPTPTTHLRSRKE